MELICKHFHPIFELEFIKISIHFDLQTSFLKYGVYDKFGPKIGGKCLQMTSIAFLWCKNIQGIEWYNLRKHTITLCGYIPGKWRKGGFLKKILRWLSYNTTQNSLCGFIFEVKINRNGVKMTSIAFLWCKKTSKGSNDMLSITIQCVCSPTNHPKNEKVFSFFKFWCIFGVIFDHPEYLEKKNFASKKIGGNLSKIQTLAVRESVIDVLSEKLNITLMWTSMTWYRSPWITTA